MDTETNEKKQAEVEMTFMDRLLRFMFGWLEGGCYVNVVLCACGVACAALGRGGRLYAVCGWICATCAWVSVCDERVWTKRWHSLADKAMKCLGAVFGGKVVGMGVCEVNGDKPQEDKPDSNDVSEDQKRAIMDLSKCIDEAIGYVKQENYEFTVSCGSVEIVMRGCPVKEAEPEPVSDGRSSNDAHDEPANTASDKA